MEPSWQPAAAAVGAARITDFQRWLQAHRGIEAHDYHELWRWSVDDVAGFWEALWEYFDVRASSRPECVLAEPSMPGASWFPGAELSYAEHVFRDKADDAVAIVHASELRPQGALTWAELRTQTARIATGLRRAGVRRGDRVAAYLPNIPESVAAFLACSSLGAIWSSCSPDFGSASVIDRFAQIEPRVLLAVDGYQYGGRNHDRRSVVAELEAALPTLERTFVLPYAGGGDWGELVADEEPLRFEQLPFDHPLWILYSSGTTGPPKPIVHGQGGILLEHLKVLNLHFDARADDRLFWFTTTGWMMWNLLLGGLLTEAAIVLYDGSPAYPTPDALWDLAESAGVTCFGTSAAYIHAAMKAEVEPHRGRALSALRSVGSTGSPLSADGFRWVREQVGDVWLFSTSGGTDLCTAFVGGVPTLPVYDGELQARSLGARVEAFDADGKSVVDEVGELVLTAPMPSMPLYFWGDDGTRYRESYFDTYPGVWRHGDWIEITNRGTAVISGRSDATVNRGGIRIGTSEIYRAVLSVDEVVDALVVDVGDWLPLFVVLRGDVAWTDELVAAIKAAIRERCSPRHVPDEVLRVDAIPRTRSGKILEVPIKRILSGVSLEAALTVDAVANPEALEPFLALAASLDRPASM